MENNKVYMVIYDDGREFDYTLFKQKENAEKKYYQMLNDYFQWVKVEKDGKYRINCEYGAWLDLREEILF